MAEQIQPERSSRSVSIVAEGSAESPGRVPLLGFYFLYLFVVPAELGAVEKTHMDFSCGPRFLLCANTPASCRRRASLQRMDLPARRRGKTRPRTARGRPSPCATANRPPACCCSAGPLAVGVRGQPCRSLVVSEPLRKMRFARRCSAASATSGSSMLKQFCWRR